MTRMTCIAVGVASALLVGRPIGNVAAACNDVVQYSVFDGAEHADDLVRHWNAIYGAERDNRLFLASPRGHVVMGDRVLVFTTLMEGEPFDDRTLTDVVVSAKMVRSDNGVTFADSSVRPASSPVNCEN